MELTKWGFGRTNREQDDTLGVHLIDDETHVLSICENPDGTVTFLEECDGYFYATMPKADAILALQEAISFLESKE